MIFICGTMDAYRGTDFLYGIWDEESGECITLKDLLEGKHKSNPNLTISSINRVDVRLGYEAWTDGEGGKEIPLPIMKQAFGNIVTIDDYFADAYLYQISGHVTEGSSLDSPEMREVMETSKLVKEEIAQDLARKLRITDEKAKEIINEIFNFQTIVDMFKYNLNLNLDQKGVANSSAGVKEIYRNSSSARVESSIVRNVNETVYMNNFDEELYLTVPNAVDMVEKANLSQYLYVDGMTYNGINLDSEMDEEEEFDNEEEDNFYDYNEGLDYETGSVLELGIPCIPLAIPAYRDRLFLYSTDYSKQSFKLKFNSKMVKPEEIAGLDNEVFTEHGRDNYFEFEITGSALANDVVDVVDGEYIFSNRMGEVDERTGLYPNEEKYYNKLCEMIDKFYDYFGMLEKFKPSFFGSIEELVSYRREKEFNELTLEEQSKYIEWMAYNKWLDYKKSPYYMKSKRYMHPVLVDYFSILIKDALYYTRRHTGLVKSPYIDMDLFTEQALENFTVEDVIGEIYGITADDLETAKGDFNSIAERRKKELAEDGKRRRDGNYTIAQFKAERREWAEFEGLIMGSTDGMGEGNRQKMYNDAESKSLSNVLPSILGKSEDRYLGAKILIRLLRWGKRKPTKLFLWEDREGSPKYIDLNTGVEQLGIDDYTSFELMEDEQGNTREIGSLIVSKGKIQDGTYLEQAGIGLSRVNLPVGLVTIKKLVDSKGNIKELPVYTDFVTIVQEYRLAGDDSLLKIKGITYDKDSDTFNFDFGGMNIDTVSMAKVISDINDFTKSDVQVDESDYLLDILSELNLVTIRYANIFTCLNEMQMSGSISDMLRIGKVVSDQSESLETIKRQIIASGMEPSAIVNAQIMNWIGDKLLKLNMDINREALNDSLSQFDLTKVLNMYNQEMFGAKEERKDMFQETSKQVSEKQVEVPDLTEEISLDGGLVIEEPESKKAVVIIVSDKVKFASIMKNGSTVGYVKLDGDKKEFFGADEVEVVSGGALPHVKWEGFVEGAVKAAALERWDALEKNNISMFSKKSHLMLKEHL